MGMAWFGKWRLHQQKIGKHMMARETTWFSQETRQVGAAGISIIAMYLPQTDKVGGFLMTNGYQKISSILLAHHGHVEHIICVNDPYDTPCITKDDERLASTGYTTCSEHINAGLFKTLLCSVSNKGRLQKWCALTWLPWPRVLMLRLSTLLAPSASTFKPATNAGLQFWPAQGWHYPVLRMRSSSWVGLQWSSCHWCCW